MFINENIAAENWWMSRYPENTLTPWIRFCVLIEVLNWRCSSVVCWRMYLSTDNPAKQIRSFNLTVFINFRLKSVKIVNIEKKIYYFLNLKFIFLNYSLFKRFNWKSKYLFKEIWFVFLKTENIIINEETLAISYKHVDTFINCLPQTSKPTLKIILVFE